MFKKVLKTKGFLIVLGGVLMFGAAQAKTLGEILRDANGHIRVMPQFEALGQNPHTNKKIKPDACEAAGKGRLPSVREFAEIAKANGARGILEVNPSDPDSVPPGYYKVSAINTDGQRDDFYFSSTGLKTPPEFQGLWLPIFWSSSVYIDSRVYGAYLFDFNDDYEFNGILFSDRGTPDSAVFCVP